MSDSYQMSQSIDPPMSSYYSNESSSSGLLSNIYFRIFIAIIILSFFGFNMFDYLGNVIDTITHLLKQFTDKFNGTFGKYITNTAKQTISTSADGTKKTVDLTANTIDKGIDKLDNALNISSANRELNDAIDIKRYIDNNNNNIPLPDESHNITQKNKAGKKGFCYIGTDRGYRSCVEINKGDTCMSGDVYESKKKCINPDLRY